MAGIFGDEINSRQDFFQTLQQGKALVTLLVSKRPNEFNLKSVQTQIEAIEAWTANGRKPTLEERGKVALGYRLHREYEGTSDPEIYALKELASAIQNYVRHWPDDAVARDPNNEWHRALQ